MSSAIPARLLFQCGHAALVTLPRVKGETAAQRNERIAREKNEALARQCDFCGPTVDVAVQTNGNHLEVADVLAAEPVVVAEQPIVAEEPVVFVEEPVLMLEDTEPTQELPVEQEEPVVMVVEESVPELEEPVLVVEETIVTEPVIVFEESVSPSRRGRRRRTSTAPTQRVTSTARQYAVEYRVERILRATNIQDALRQAASLGAKEILAIDRLPE